MSVELTSENLFRIVTFIRLLREAEAETRLTIDGNIIINDDTVCLGSIVGNDSDFLFVPA